MMELEQNTVVYPPNKQLEREISFSNIPVIYNNLMYLDFNSEGNCILGSSSVTKTLWEGTLIYSENETDLLDLKYTNHYINSTASDGLFIKRDVILLAEDTGALNVLRVNKEVSTPLAEDTGALNVLRVNKEVSTIESTNSIKHFHLIPKIAIWENTEKVLTCSGRDLHIWDINDQAQKSTKSFIHYHGDFINYVDTLKTETNLFLSASNDRKCCIWDDRNQIPASVLYHNEFSALTSVAWNQTDPNYIAVGTEVGNVYLIDKRNPDDFVAALQCLEDSIHRLLYNKNMLAVCGDGREVVVLSSGKNGFVDTYRNAAHKDIVRGLAWHKDTLYSCGFDKAVIKHVL